LSVPTTKRPSEVALKQPESPATQDAVSSQSPSVSPTPIVPAPAIPPAGVQEPASNPEHDSAGVQHSEEEPGARHEEPEDKREETAAKQEEPAKDIATPQLLQDSKQETLSPATQGQPTPALAPETKPATVASWTLREVTNGTAVLAGPSGTLRVTRGDTVPGLGKVTSIVRWGNGWVVAATAGYCTSSPVDHADGICKPYRD